MAIPRTRDEFKEYCLRKLGAPVTQINVADIQVEDRIDDAIQMYTDYHYDGTEEIFYVYAINTTDIENGYVTLPTHITGATEIYRPNAGGSSAGIFNVRFQLQQSDFLGRRGAFGSNGALTGYVMAKQHLNLIQDTLVGPVSFSFNRRTNKLLINEKLIEGETIVVQGFSSLPVDSNGDITIAGLWNDEWIKKYSVELIRQQWGSNLGKFNGVQLPGGVTMNGQEIYDKATDNIENLEKELKEDLQMPTQFFIG